MIEVRLYIYTLDVGLLSKEGLVSHNNRRGVHLDTVIRLVSCVLYDLQAMSEWCGVKWS